jgi:hypothetical protein
MLSHQGESNRHGFIARYLIIAMANSSNPQSEQTKIEGYSYCQKVLGFYLRV